MLQVTFDNMGQGVVMFDRDLQMVAWNRHFQGTRPADDRRPRHFLRAVLRYLAERGDYGPCDVELEVQRHLASVDRLYTDERTRPDGTVLDIRRNPCPAAASSRSMPMSPNSGTHRPSCSWRARLTDAIESLSDGFALGTRTTELVIFNSRCKELFDASICSS